MFKKRNATDLRKRFEQEGLVHLDSLYGMALRLTRHERDAEDLVQDTLVRAYRAFERFEQGTNIKGWLFKILTNTFYNTRRKAANMTRLHTEAERGGHQHRFVAQASDVGGDVEAAVLEQLGLEKIRRALDALPEAYRLVVALSDLHEFSYREIAEIVDCPVGTVMSRLHRGRQMLRGSLAEQAGALGLVQRPGTQGEAEAAAKTTARVTELSAYRQKVR